tara:strand:- start:2230 stop:3102 length:873 start_codon:yes stop_codon:yes gene_type:complete
MMNKSKKSVGVIGNGFVGSAVAHGFTTFNEVRVYDSDPKKKTHELKDVLSNSDFIFVCLPTPMTSAEGGKADLSIIHSFFEDALKSNSRRSDQIFIIKSTVPIGTTRDLVEKFNLRIVHCPEFLTARTAKSDFICSSRNIVGCIDKKAGEDVKQLLSERLPGTPVQVVAPEESELIKYAMNCFFSTKIMFFNMLKELSDGMNLNWDSVIEGVMSDGRVGQSHFQVPGWDGDRGFGGGCFPKDINAMIKTMQDHGVSSNLLQVVWDENKRVRENWDWAEMKSAVSNMEKDN